MSPAKAYGRKIAILGASGQLGKPTVEALLKAGVHTVTAVQRADATSTLPAGVIVKKGNLEDEEFLASALQGQDVLVLMPPLSHIVSLQEPAVRAAAKVGVPYIFPSEFGPDPFATKLIEQNVLLQAKKKIRDLIDELGVSSWVSVAVGPWLDANLGNGLWGIDIKERKATIWSGADSLVSVASVEHTGKAVAAAIGLPEDKLQQFKGKAIYAPSLRVSQRDILSAVQQVTGTHDSDWDIQTRPVANVISEYEDGIKNGNEFSHYVKFFVTHFLANSGADLQGKVASGNVADLQQLGLEGETIADAVRKSGLFA